MKISGAMKAKGKKMKDGVVLNLDDGVESEKAGICISCFICGEYVPLDEYESSALNYGCHVPLKICNKCRKAILIMRKRLEEGDEDGTKLD